MVYHIVIPTSERWWSQTHTSHQGSVFGMGLSGDERRAVGTRRGGLSCHGHRWKIRPNFLLIGNHQRVTFVVTYHMVKAELHRCFLTTFDSCKVCRLGQCSLNWGVPYYLGETSYKIWSLTMIIDPFNDHIIVFEVPSAHLFNSYVQITIQNLINLLKSLWSNHYIS